MIEVVTTVPANGSLTVDHWPTNEVTICDGALMITRQEGMVTLAGYSSTAWKAFRLLNDDGTEIE
ncbi:hypothetical protein [Corynebacterium jeikeium]|uniref:hypothetical protein n=1 Tax=Corynebacterium jeikeium TaxID=38289 RepID=UPI000880266D|nr:hypothetical protein [Corynebacterium jeikeium]SCX06743.1 hypothetical protein CJBVI_0507 [Corynebacterium jeikeium]